MLLRRNLPSRNLGEILYKFKITSILRSCRQFSVSDHNDVLFSDHGTLGKLVVLDRPNALNALNLKMLERLVEFYRQLRKLSDPKVVVVRGSGGKAFCAGGDARELYFLRRNNKYISGLAPTSDNLFRVAQLVGELPQHIQHVCLMDGVTMGGGAALSVNGRFRVCTERSLFAMPETALGWFPDAGGAYFLPRMTRNFGVFLALTGAHVKGADLLHSITSCMSFASTPILTNHTPIPLTAYEHPDREGWYIIVFPYIEPKDMNGKLAFSLNDSTTMRRNHGKFEAEEVVTVAMSVLSRLFIPLHSTSSPSVFLDFKFHRMTAFLDLGGLEHLWFFDIHARPEVLLLSRSQIKYQTEEYMSPEERSGSLQTCASNIFQLGISLLGIRTHERQKG
eukprot:749263_1